MNGKRKINIIDILVVIVLITAVCVVGVSKFISASSESRNTKNIRITFYAEEVSDSIVENIKIGDVVTDSVTKVDFGECKDIIIEDSVSYIATKNNEYIKASRDGYKSLTLICESTGIYSDIGAVYDGDNTYGVGHTFTAFVGDSRITVRVRNLEIAGE